MSAHVIDHLSLWVEGDLSAEELRRIDAHLAHCPACRAEAEAYRVSQAWLKDEADLPFGPDDLQDLRGAVMDRIAAEPHPLRRPSLPRWPILAAAALLLGAGLAWPLLRTPGPAPIQAAPVPTLAAPAPSLAAPAPTLAALAPGPTPPPAAPQGSEPPLPRVYVRVRGRPRQPTFRPAPALRMELQTPNPNVRILWLPHSTEPTPGPSGLS